MVGGRNWGVAEDIEEADGFAVYFGDKISRIGYELSWGEARGIKHDSQVFGF